MLNRRPLVVLGLLLALLLPALFQIALPFLTPALLAAVLAIVLHPANRWLTLRTKRPHLAAAVTTTTAIVMLGAMVVFAGVAFARELRSSYEALKVRSLEEGGWPALVTRSTDHVVDALAARVPLDKQAIQEGFMNGLQSVSGKLLNYMGSALGGLPGLAIGAIFTAVFLYFFLLRGTQWLAALEAMIPLEQNIIATLFQTVEDSVTATVYGVLAVALGQGLFVTLGFWVAGVRSPVLWGTVGGLASIIPVLGTPLVWVPIVIAFAITGAWWKALFLGLWGALVVGSVDNVLRPLVVGVRAKQHPLMMALGALGGTFAFGVIGVLIGPLLVSLAGALVKEIQLLLADKAADR